ncbi:MAG: 50S ribosomal protein L32e [Nanoarchaeota archaeon]|nr:50S ribosomal protein L32e [Nanoarchaeota archaeon]MBU1632759.1 50S ribosomal protein L32e [Nanoarchaeota archaeon]MBU1876401.1 50S ribosomal protein L32e [Nanoarchaeota archaeon]
MAIEKLLDLRKELKKKKPTFVVKESKFSARVKSRWRFPRGKHSKVRQMHCGRPALPSTGYGSPKEVKGLHSSGLEPVIVHNTDDLNVLDTKKQGAVIAKNVGARKRIEILELAKNKKITIINSKDIDESLKSIKEKFEERKNLKKEKLAQSSKKEEEKKKKAEERKKEEEAKKAKEAEDKKEETLVDNKDEKEEQKEIIEKTITKRQ